MTDSAEGRAWGGREPLPPRDPAGSPAPHRLLRPLLGRCEAGGPSAAEMAAGSGGPVRLALKYPRPQCQECVDRF